MIHHMSQAFVLERANAISCLQAPVSKQPAPDAGNPPLALVRNLQLKMNQWVRAHHAKANEAYSFMGDRKDGLILEQQILTDALTFLELTANQHQRSFTSNPQVQEKFLNDFYSNLSYQRINFNRAVKIGAQLLQLPPPPDFSEWIHQHPNFVHDPALRTELDLFINRGNYFWSNFGESTFRNFLKDPSKLKLCDNAKINCWEAVLYSLIRSDAISRTDLNRIYTGSSDSDAVLKSLSQAFRWETSKHITTKQQFVKAALYNPYFIEISGNSADNGLSHSMVSFPGSTTKMLQTLVSGCNQGKPDQKLTFYSHWTPWTNYRLGNPANVDAINYMMKHESRIIPLPVFIKLFPKISQTAQAMRRNLEIASANTILV